jgi:hypothetical protein
MIRFYVSFAFWAALGFLVFRYVAGFSDTQAVVLACVVAWFNGSITLLSRAADFKPLQLAVTVIPWTIMSDLGLLGSETWEAYSDRYTQQGIDWHEVPLRAQPFTFTTIGPRLVHCSDPKGTQTFNASMRIYFDLKGVGIPWNPGPFSLIGNTAKFFLRQAYRHKMVGYEFGVRIVEEWWKTARMNAHPSLRDLSVQEDGGLILGFLPEAYMSQHVQKWHEPIRLFENWKQSQQKWNKKLTTLGWKVNDDEPESIEHKYLVVRHWNLGA